VNWNSYEVTAVCIDSLRNISYPNARVIVVDNASIDDSARKLKTEYPEIKLLLNSVNTGFTGGNNTGIQWALDWSFDLIMLLNNDTVVTPGFADRLVETYQKDDNIGVVQPKILFNKRRDLIWNAGSTYNSFFCYFGTKGFMKADLGQYNEVKEIPWVTGCCFLLSTDIVRKVGLLDEKFFMYFEDSDWSFKIRELGYRLLYQPASIIYHEAGMSEKNQDEHGEGNVSPFTRYVGVRNHLYFIKRHVKGFNTIGAWTYQILRLLAFFFYFLFRGRFKKLKAVLTGFRDGLLG
jgi:GT2 family glycosyltransferase